ncbi:MAG: 30S ribosomal protein S6 [bacterium]|nr:30S ribosomal protein S6 [bacterium]
MASEETALLDADMGVVAVAPIEEAPAELRIYEIGYHILPAVKEEDVEKIVSGIRSIIEKAGGSFIAEGAPSLIRLAYPMSALAVEGEKRVEYDRGYFGWIKFESDVSATSALTETLKSDANILRFGIFRTVREDTRAKMKAPTMREVKRTDTIKSSPRRAPEEISAPVSESDLEKAIQDITTE